MRRQERNDKKTQVCLRTTAVSKETSCIHTNRCQYKFHKHW